MGVNLHEGHRCGWEAHVQGMGEFDAYGSKGRLDTPRGVQW